MFDVDLDQVITIDHSIDHSMSKYCEICIIKKKEVHRSQFKYTALYNKSMIINPSEWFAILTSS